MGYSCSNSCHFTLLLHLWMYCTWAVLTPARPLIQSNNMKLNERHLGVFCSCSYHPYPWVLRFHLPVEMTCVKMLRQGGKHEIHRKSDTNRPDKNHFPPLTVSSRGEAEIRPLVVALLLGFSHGVPQGEHKDLSSLYFVSHFSLTFTHLSIYLFAWQSLGQEV